MTLLVVQTVCIRVCIPSFMLFTSLWSRFTLAAYFMLCDSSTMQFVLNPEDNAISVTATFRFLDEVRSNLKAFPNAFNVTSLKVLGSLNFNLQ